MQSAIQNLPWPQDRTRSGTQYPGTHSGRRFWVWIPLSPGTAPVPRCTQSCERGSTELYHHVSSSASLGEPQLGLKTKPSGSGSVKGCTLLDWCRAAESPQGQSFGAFVRTSTFLRVIWISCVWHNLSAGLQSFSQQNGESGARGRARVAASTTGGCWGCCHTYACLRTSF